MAKMGSVISAHKGSAAKQVTQALLLSNLDYCPAARPDATEDFIKKSQTGQHRAARMVLCYIYKINIVSMHESLHVWNSLSRIITQ